MSTLLKDTSLSKLQWSAGGRDGAAAEVRPAAGVVAIASSTGGPEVLRKILSALPANFPYAILIAQHIAPGFASGLVRWLGRSTPLAVKLAAGGEPLLAGTIYISPTERNLIVGKDGRTALVDGHPDDLYHPSCDALLTSVGERFGGGAIGVILTGMGRDGVNGIIAIKNAGGMTIAQDEASSVVFGMNGVAVRGGHVAIVAEAGNISKEIQQFVYVNRRRLPNYC